MKRYKSIFIFIIASAIFAGCNSVTPDISKPIDSKIRFEIYESHSASVNSNEGYPELHIGLFTEKYYPCSNYGLNFIRNTFGENITIDLISLRIPNICLTSFGPATADLPLGVGAGKYNLKIKMNGELDSYIINISDSVVTISNGPGKISSTAYYKYFRYPKNSFAYYCGTTVEDKYICDDFLDTLKSKINIKEYYFPNDGRKPYPDSLGGHYYEMPAKFFIYNSGQDFDKIDTILSSYKKSVIKDKQGIGISIVNWENKYFYSWLY